MIPIDPAEVRIGDRVEVAYTGTVKHVGADGQLTLTNDGEEVYYGTRGARVWLMHRAGPDPAEVEALYQVLYETHNGGGTGEPPDERWSETYHEIARRLAVRGVKVRDGHE